MDVDLKYLVEAKKTFPFKPSWKKRDDKWMHLVSPLDINSVTIEGLKFRIQAMIERPDENMTFQIEYCPVNSLSKGRPLERIDWKPFAAHNNKNIGPIEYRHALQKCSHYHSFSLNWDHNQSAFRKGELPLALPVEPEPSSYEEVIVFVGKKFNLFAVEMIPDPPWEPILF